MEIFEIAKSGLDETLTWKLREKGYGDRSQELQLFTQFFKEVFKNYPELKSFEWNQHQDFNDNHLYFDLHNFKINGTVETSFSGFDWWNDDEDWDYWFNSDKMWEASRVLDSKGEEDWHETEKNLQAKLAYLRPSLDCIITFLKALYDFYKPHYFIYVFGRRARVVVSQEGISIDNQNIAYFDGDEWDKKHYL